MISLIGMPGSGKTSLSKALRKYGWRMIDTDEMIADKMGMPVADFVEQYGEFAFRLIEGEIILGLAPRPHPTIVATGGSVVYSKGAGHALCALGPVVWLQASEETLKGRVPNLRERGVIHCSLGLHDLLAERNPRYEAYSTHRLAVDGKSIDDLAAEFQKMFGKTR